MSANNAPSSLYTLLTTPQNGEHTEPNAVQQATILPATVSPGENPIWILASGPDLIDANQDQHPGVGAVGLRPEEDERETERNRQVVQ